MTAFADDDWAEPRPHQTFSRPATWAIASALVHLLLIAWVLSSPEQEPMTLADRQVMDRPAVELVMVDVRPSKAPRPDASVATDRPETALPPRIRTPKTPSDILDLPPVAAVEAIDPAALNAFLERQEQAAKTADGMGATWQACSLLSPERRILEPACDGMLLKRGEAPGIAATLESPDGEVLAAVKRIEESDPAAKKKRGPAPRDVSVGEDNQQDRSYRNQTDERYGPMPWE